MNLTWTCTWCYWENYFWRRFCKICKMGKDDEPLIPPRVASLYTDK